MKKRILAALLFYPIFIWAQDTVYINPAIQHQTIKGWGGTGGQNTQFEGIPPYLITQIINESVDGLGLTGLRYECFQGSYSQSYAMCRSWEWANDNGSPDTTAWSAFDTTAVDYYMQNLFVPWKNKVVGNGDPFTFYESPSWYLAGSTGDIPAFLRYNPGEYAEYLISNLQYLKNKYGLTADFVTVCNEAGNNNVFTPQLVDTMIKTVGARLQASGLSTTIQFPECLSAQVTWNYIQALQTDPTIWPYIKCLSYHLYGTNDPYRAQIQSFAQSKGIPTAQTEYTGLGIDLLFQDILLGGVSYWDFYGNTDYMPLNASSTWFTHGAKFWTTRQLIRHVRPGAVRIDAVSNDATIKSVAFQDAGQVTTIILNDSATSITQNVTVSGLPAGNYGVGQTTTSGTYSELGIVTVGGTGTATINVKAQSVISIYPHAANMAPVATLWSANPSFLDLPATTITLSSGAIDPELSTVTYHWTIDSFPSGATVLLSNANVQNPSASGLNVPGNYVFGVHFSDGTDITTKQVTVQVFASNQPPVISTLQSRIPVLVTLPVDTTVLQGAAFDLEGDALTMQFSVISQPAGAAAQLVTLQTNAGSMRSAARNMTVPGDYVFQFMVSDGSHNVSRSITVTVYPLNNAPVISSVSASPAIVTTPASSADLSAITSDPDGDTVTHWWLITSAPGGANPVFSAQGERMTTVSNLTVPGTYVFTLRAIDRTLFATRNDTITVNSILPVSLFDLSAELISPQTVSVTWETATESNSSRFEIQRSVDGHTFTSIGTVSAAGTSNVLLNYSYKDNSLSNAGSQLAAVYYRIKELDTDGKEVYSSIAIVPLSNKLVSMLINPNPVSDMLSIQAFNVLGDASLTVYDVTGRVLFLQHRQILAGNILNVNTAALTKGCYYVQLKVMNTSLQQAFIKE